MDKKLLLDDVAEAMDFVVISGFKGLKRYVEEEMVARPGMEFAGFFDFYEPKRIVVIGTKEITFFNRLDIDTQKARIEYLFSLNPPAFVFSQNVVVPHIFIKLAEEYHIPVFKSNLRTTPLLSKLYSYLQEHLTTKLNVHGVLVDINGMGTLIMGKSGVGKSETALELINRGHQLIADDRVEIFQKEIGVLVGSAPKILEKYIEIRGIGIVDVVQMFGVGAFRETKKIRLVVEIEKWEQNKYYDRIGLNSEKIKFFDTEIPKVVIPVLPGRNVAMLVESAAMNEKLKYLGYNGAKDFTEAVNRLTRRKENQDD